MKGRIRQGVSSRQDAQRRRAKGSEVVSANESRPIREPPRRNEPNDEAVFA